MSFLRLATLCLLALLVGFSSVPALAQDEDPTAGFDAEASLRAVVAERRQFDGEDLDSSGVGSRLEIGYEVKADKTEFRLEVDANVYDYFDNGRQTREGYGGRARIKQALSKTLSASAEGRYAANIITLEAPSVDQKSVRGTLAWEAGNNRVTGFVDHRWRSYDGVVRSHAKGTRAGIEYRRRFGSWHWLSVDVAHERNKSIDLRRGYERVSVTIDYSRPIAKNLRLRGAIEARRWSYDGRIAQGAAPATLRKDKIFGPELGLAYGKSKGLYANARASYEVRASNDVRFKKDGPRFEMAFGFRF